jgi:hypothetical protein
LLVHDTLYSRAMESWFELDSSHNVGRWVLKGHVTDGGFVQSLETVCKIIAGLTLSAGIIDFTEVTAFDVSEAVLKDVALTSPVLSREMLRLVVAPEDKAFARARLFAMLSESSRPNVFVVRSLEAANHLLGIKDPNFQRIEDPLLR